MAQELQIENHNRHTLHIAVRVVELIVGLVFLLAAVLKLKDANLFVAQIFQYQVFTNPTLLGLTAIKTLFFEVVLGLLMVFGVRLRGIVPALVLAILLFFTGLIAYAWPEDCGCFGAVKMGPGVSIAKNIIMMLGAAAILIWGRREEGWPRGATGARVMVSLLAGLAAAAYAYPQVFQSESKSAQAPPAAMPTATATESPTAATPPAAATATPPAAASGVYAGYVVESEFGEQFDLSHGDYLVASLSLTCEHCMASVPILNELSMDPTLPKLVALAMESAEGDKDNFVAETQPTFPIKSIGNNFLEFSKLIADSPPRLALVRNGSPVLTWDKELPPAAEIASAVAGALAGVPPQ